MSKVRIAAIVAALGWMGVIFALSAIPGSALPGRFSSLGHFMVYACLGFLYCAAAGRQRPVWRGIAIAVALASLYGITDEFHQSFVPGRMPDVMDWLVDTMGAAVGASALALAWRRRSQAA